MSFEKYTEEYGKFDEMICSIFKKEYNPIDEYRKFMQAISSECTYD